MIYVNHYTLSEKRRGALLKVESERGVGYADLHPWPELGDPSLEESLAGKGPLLERSLVLAAIDADHRARGIPVDLSQVPESHFLLSNLGELERAVEEGFAAVKIKVSTLSNELHEAIRSSPIRWRIDGNGRLSKGECEKLPHKQIEFFEDPYPGVWTKGAVPLAYDRGEEPAYYDIRIVKPALHRWETIPRTHPVVVTSYLGHPIGQVADAYVAAQMKNTLVGGLLSHRVYPKNSFSERLPWRGPRMVHPGGTGFGFDDILEQLDWRKR